MKLNLYLLILLLFAAFGCNQEDKTITNLPSGEIGAASIDIPEEHTRNESVQAECRAEFKKALASAEAVAKRTDNNEAINLVKFSKENGEYQDELPEHFEWLDEKQLKRLPKYKVYVIHQSDTEYWAAHYLQDPVMTANFHPGKGGMILRRTQEYSDLWLGMIFLHETRHARVYLKEHPEWVKSWIKTGEPDPLLFCQDEASCHIFQGELFRKVGGKPYRLLVEEFAHKLNLVAPRPLKEVFNLPVQSDQLYQYPDPMEALGDTDMKSVVMKIDEIFGPSLSEREAISRISLIMIDAMFLLADRLATDPLAAKTAYLGNLYQIQGMM